MASQGPLSGGTFTDDATVGSVSWSNPSNAASSNDVYAVASVGFVQTTHYLRVTNFGFTIPGGANIDGVTVEVERKQSSASVLIDSSVRLYTGSFVGSDKAAGVALPTTDTYVTYGGAADVWGAALTDSNVNASTFGVGYSVTYNTGISSDASVDHVRITINYTAAAGGGAAIPEMVVMGF